MSVNEGGHHLLFCFFCGLGPRPAQCSMLETLRITEDLILRSRKQLPTYK